MFNTFLQTSNCSGSSSAVGRVSVQTCGIGKFCCLDGCCTDFTYFLILLIVVSMIVIVAVFIHVEVVKERRFNEKLKRHVEATCHRQRENCDDGGDDSRICLGASPIDACPFNNHLPPSCSPPMTVPKLDLHKKSGPIRHFLLHKHL